MTLDSWGLATSDHCTISSAEYTAYDELQEIDLRDSTKDALAIKKLNDSFMVAHAILYSNDPIEEAFRKCRHFYSEKLYMEHVRILFDHKKPMLDHVRSKMSEARPILEKLLTESTDKKKLKKIKDANLLTDFEYAIEALCILFNEPRYLVHVSEASSDKDLKDLSLVQESPIILVKLDNENYGIVIQRKVVLRYKSLATSFAAYVASFAVFNLSWNSVNGLSVNGKVNYCPINVVRVLC